MDELECKADNLQRACLIGVALWLTTSVSSGDSTKQLGLEDLPRWRLAHHISIRVQSTTVPIKNSVATTDLFALTLAADATTDLICRKQ